MKKSHLDFDVLPSLNKAPIFHALSDETQKALSPLPETLDRAYAAVHFSYNIDSPPRSSDDNRQRLREAYFRASISEFVGMEDALPRDLSAAPSAKRPLKITDTNDPLLHMLRELRNLEIHLQSSEVTSTPSMVFFSDPNEEELQALDTEMWHIKDLTVSRFKELRNASRYEDRTIQKMVEWFNEAQKVWGVAELILIGTERYCSRIADHCLP